MTASLIALAAGALLFEAVWTRTGNRANAWWTTLSGELATRPVDDAWILAGAAVAAALGLVLLIAALTPGKRRKLPMKVGPRRQPPRDAGRSGPQECGVAPA